MVPDPSQRPPYLDWSLDRWKIGVAIVLFTVLATWHLATPEQPSTAGRVETTALSVAVPAIQPHTTAAPAEETAETAAAGVNPAIALAPSPAETPTEAPTIGSTATATATTPAPTTSPTALATPTALPAPAETPTATSTPATTPTVPPAPKPLTLAVFEETAGLLRNNRPLLHGTAPGGAVVVLDVGGAPYAVEASVRGEWQFVPPQPLPLGMTWVRAHLADAAGEQMGDAISTILGVGPEAVPVAPPSIAPLPVDAPLLTNIPVLSGDGPPGASLRIYQRSAGDGPPEPLGETIVDLNGRWSWRPEQPLPAGEHELRAAVLSDDSVPLTRSPSLLLVIAPAAQPRRPPAVTPLLLPDSDPETGAARAVLIVALTGTAPPAARLFLYLDGDRLDEIVADAEGNWRYDFPEPLGARQHDIRLVEVDAAGRPLAISAPPILPVRVTLP